MKKTDKKALLFGLNIFSNQKSQLLSLLKKWLLESKSLRVVYTPNPEQIVQSRGNNAFKHALQKADLLLPDGIGLVWAACFLAKFGKAKLIQERIAGVDVVAELLKIARQKELAVLVIGGRNYSPADYFAYRGAKINWLSGYQNINQPTAAEEKSIKKSIKKLQPDLVFVAFGAPAQELWIEQHRGVLAKSGVKIAMAVGGSFDYLLGKVPRAPYWFRKLGLEWLFRLLVEPWRVRRQLRIISFLGLTLQELVR